MKSVCKSCRREYIYNSKSKKGHTKDKCNSCCVNSRRISLREFINSFKESGCSICGYNKNKSALQFHHVDKTTKLFSISGNHCRSKEAIEMEIKKCIVVCANCHSEIHNPL